MPPFLGQAFLFENSPFPEIQDVPTFYKPKYWMTLLSDWYIISNLILEEYWQKWWNLNLI